MRLRGRGGGRPGRARLDGAGAVFTGRGARRFGPGEAPDVSGSLARGCAEDVA